jgi:hypothetical protein
LSTSNLSFSASVAAWVSKTKGLERDLFRASVQDVVSIAQLRIPVDTGFARASIRGSTSQMPQINHAAKGADGPVNFGVAETEITLLINGLEIGETFYVGWTAAYSLPLEYGHSKQAPSGFVRLAAQQWQTIVDTNVERVKHLSGAN